MPVNFVRYLQHSRLPA